MSHYGRLLRAEMIDQADDVSNHLVDPVILDPRRFVAKVVTSQVRCNDVKVFAEATS